MIHGVAFSTIGIMSVLERFNFEAFLVLNIQISSARPVLEGGLMGKN